MDEVEQFRKSFDPYLAVILLFASILVFSGLGDRVLWQDEAETGIYARSILRDGLPRGDDDGNVASQVGGRDLTGSGLVKIYWTPWLPLYTAAAGAAILGDSEFALRFPFALLGLITIFLSYKTALALGCDLNAARFGALAAATCVPFLLQARQARGYTLVTALVLGFILAVAGKSRRAAIWSGILGASLFYANHVFAIGFLSATSATINLLPPYRGFRATLTKSIGIALSLSLPGILAITSQLNDPQIGSVIRVVSATEEILDNTSFYLGCTLTYIFPIPLLLALCLPGDSTRRLAGLFGTIAAGYVIFLALFWPPFFRYLMPIVPLLLITVGTILARVWNWKKAVALPVAAIVLFTNLFHFYPIAWLEWQIHRKIVSGPPRGVASALSYLVTEIKTHYRGPNWGLVTFFQEAGDPKETIIATYGDLPLQYYTEMRVLGGLQGESLRRDTAPEWLVPRAYPLTDVGRRIQERIANRAQYGAYVEIELPVADLPWGNRPSPLYHPYVSSDSGTLLTILVRPDVFKRKRAKIESAMALIATGTPPAILGQ